MATKKPKGVTKVKASDMTEVDSNTPLVQEQVFTSLSGRTTITVEMRDEGAYTVIVERDGHNLFRQEMGREERPVGS